MDAELCTILVELLKSLKSFVISRTTGLYGFKYVNSTASAGVFRTYALINWSVLL
jgi:hypothetical protein